MFAACDRGGIWIGMLFVGCDDEASEDALSHGLRGPYAQVERMKNKPHKVENSEVESVYMKWPPRLKRLD